jgi:hypothetical protein
MVSSFVTGDGTFVLPTNFMRQESSTGVVAHKSGTRVALDRLFVCACVRVCMWIRAHMCLPDARRNIFGDGGFEEAARRYATGGRACRVGSRPPFACRVWCLKLFGISSGRPQDSDQATKRSCIVFQVLVEIGSMVVNCMFFVLTCLRSRCVYIYYLYIQTRQERNTRR